MKLGNFFVLVLACILLVSGNADAKFKRGEINSELDFAFLDHFYFANTEDNVLKYTIKYPADQCCYRLVIFDESYGQWGGIRPNEERLTCRSKIDRVKDMDYKIKLSERDQVCEVETDDAGRKWLVCRGLITFESRQRPQSYFVHLTNCRSNRKGFKDVTYTLHMTNGKNGLMKEFAENQKFIMETDLAFFLGYMAITILATRFRYVLVKKEMLHLTYRLFYGSLFFKTLSLLLLNIELSKFARTGLEMTKMQDAAEILSCLSSILFVSVLLLVSKGFSITRAHPSLFGTVKMILFGLLYAAAYAVVFFDQRVLLDPQDIIASQTSLSASGLIGIKIGGCIIFLYGCFFTIKNHPTKVLFYLPFTVFFSAWFLTEPTYRLLSINDYPVLRSPNIWNGIDLALCFAGHAFFVYITRPDRLNKRFPFHLRAARISFRDVDENLDNPYQPADDFYSVFQTEKKPPGTDTILTIPDDPEHFSTPVLPFNANSDECLVLPRPSSPTVKTMSATTTGDSPAVIPTVSATVADPGYSPRPADFELTPSLTNLAADEYRVPATRRNQKPRPHHVAITIPETPPPASTTPKKDMVYSGVTVAAPKGGFSIFSAQKPKDAPTSPTASHKDVAGPKQEKTYAVNSIRPERQNFLEPVKSFSGSPVLPPIKTIEGPGSAMQLTKAPENVCLVTCKPTDEPVKTKANEECGSDVQVSNGSRTNCTVATEGPGSTVQLPKAPQNEPLDTCRPVNEPLKTKATEGSGSDVLVSSKSSINDPVRLINVRPADDPIKTKDIEGPGSAVQLPKAPQNVPLDTCRPVDEPLKTKATGGSGSDVLVSSKSLTNDPDRLINMRPDDDPIKTKAVKGPGSAAKLPESLDVTNDADCSGSAPDSFKTKDTGFEPELPAVAMQSGKPPKIELSQVPKPFADPLKVPFEVPAPKILNWTTEPLVPQEIEHSKSSPGLISAQPVKIQKPVSLPESPLITSYSSSSEKNLKESLQNPGPHGPPTDQTIDPLSVDQDCLPTADGGDFPKRVKKTQKEPSYRRFPKPTNPGLKHDTTPDDEPQKAMDPKTKKKKLKRFLKLARKRKPKDQPPKAD